MSHIKPFFTYVYLLTVTQCLKWENKFMSLAQKNAMEMCQCVLALGYFSTVAASWTCWTVYCIVLKELTYDRGYTYIFRSINMFNAVNCGKGPVFAYMKAWRTTPLEINFKYLGNKAVYFIFKRCWILFFYVLLTIHHCIIL